MRDFLDHFGLAMNSANQQPLMFHSRLIGSMTLRRLPPRHVPASIMRARDL
jgi:hypothetical protein